MAKFIKRQGTEKVKVAFACHIHNLTFPGTSSIPDGSRLSVVFVRGTRTISTNEAVSGGGCVRWQQGVELAATLYRDKRTQHYQAKDGQLQIRVTPPSGKQRIVGTVNLRLHELVSFQPLEQTLPVENFPVQGGSLFITVTSRFMREGEDDGESSVYSAVSSASRMSSTSGFGASGRGKDRDRDRPGPMRGGGNLDEDEDEQEGEDGRRRQRSFSDPFQDSPTPAEDPIGDSPRSVFENNPFAKKRPQQQEDELLAEAEHEDAEEEAEAPEWGNKNNGGGNGGNGFGGSYHGDDAVADGSGYDNGRRRSVLDDGNGAGAGASSYSSQQQQPQQQPFGQNSENQRAVADPVAASYAAMAETTAAGGTGKAADLPPSGKRGRALPRWPLGSMGKLKGGKGGVREQDGPRVPGGASNNGSFDDGASTYTAEVEGTSSRSRSHSPALLPSWLGKKRSSGRDGEMAAAAASRKIAGESSAAAYVAQVAAEAGGDPGLEREMLRRRLAEARSDLEAMTAALIKTKLQFAQLATEHDILRKANHDLKKLRKGVAVRGSGG